MMKYFGLILFFAFNITLYSNSNMYVQSPNAKFLSEPTNQSSGRPIPIGTAVVSTGNKGLFVQVRSGTEVGWISKLFLSPYPPGKQIRLGANTKSTDQANFRQRASDFTKTAAARGLTETEKLRVRGLSEDFDFESLVWLERIGNVQNLDLSVSKTDSLWNRIFDSPREETLAEVKLGRSLAAKVIQKYGLVRNEEFTIYLNTIGNTIAKTTSRSDLSFRFGILDSNEINAFACPGGFILITKAAIQKTGTESELAGILAHEISHIALGHFEKIPTNNAFLEIISSFLGQPGGEVITGATRASLERFENEFFESGRDVQTEWEADEASIYLLAGLEYSLNDYPDYLIRVHAMKENQNLLKTHPNSLERASKIKSIIHIEFGTRPGFDHKNRFQKFKSKL